MASAGRSANLDLAIVGNCQIAALIDTRARINWMCLPRFDGDPVFSSLVDGDKDAGFFEIELVGDEPTVTQRYRPNTAILESELRSRADAVKVIDFCPRHYLYGRRFRPRMLIRLLLPSGGTPVVRVRLRPVADYGASEPERRVGSNHISYAAGDYRYRLTTDASLSAIIDERPMMIDRPVALILGSDESIQQAPLDLAEDMLGQTQRYWESWVAGLSIPFEWQDAVIRSAISLKLSAYEDTGAVVAAMTTSIPEAPRSGRNWDYRYCWLRDSYYVVQALNRLSATKTMQGFLRYITGVARSQKAKELQPVYGITGAADLTETEASALAGYRGMGPVRVGNQAYEQRQNDVYGAVVLASTRLFFDRRLPRRGDEAAFRRLEALGELAAAAFDEPDAGIWEYRGRSRVHTYSAIMCWAACDRLAKISGVLGLASERARWQAQAESMRAEISRRAWSEERKAFCESFEGDTLDASLLTAAELGFVAADDPRFADTVRAIEKELRRGDYLFRYSAADDFGEPETAFNVCTFWYIGALAKLGRRDEARALFENMLKRRNSFGLLSEDLDPVSGELWGNFPQTYSLVGIINSAIQLSDSWEQAL